MRIAIVGIGCRFPGGVSTPEQLRDFLQAHGDGVRDVPPERWSLDLFYDPEDQAPGKSYVKRAAFLDQDVFAFDPQPFGISPREADRLDPQQRLLHEVAWEALEDAGYPIDQLRGSNTGVYIGGFMLDYRDLVAALDNQRRINIHTATGISLTVLSNRLSYTFDFHGPSITVDTACSSSLVATHLACQALSNGECDLAISGGVNVMLSPLSTLIMSKGQFLAKDGRSKAFDAAADGYGRGEGAGLVILKRLDEAIADSDRIYAVILGIGANQDGRTDGLPMPNGEAQRLLCEAVLSSSGVQPGHVGYVEAHGTGTRAGDPIEARALGSVYCRDHARAKPLLVGSIKTNIGHLEAAAGIAGLIKAALCVSHREILPLRGLDAPNPEIPFQDLNLQLALDSQLWPQNDGPAIAAINSFGYGGTNAHALVGEYREESAIPVVLSSTQQQRPTKYLVPVSAFSRETLSARANQLAEHLHKQPARWLDQAYTLARRRTHLPERAIVVAGRVEELKTGLRSLAQGKTEDGVILGHAPRERRLLWVFTGMGPQWWGMGQELYRTETAFRAAVEELDAHFRHIAHWSILAKMLRSEADSRMSTNAIAQPANLVLQVGLVALLRDLGVPADGLLGHSVGELAAAWAGGCLSLADTARIVYHRSQLQQTTAGQGTMLAVALSPEEAQSHIPKDADVVIAGYNAPQLVTLAGTRSDLETIASKLEAQGTFNRFVAVEVAYHSPHMEPLQDRLVEALSPIAPMPPTVPLYSTVLGSRITTDRHGPDYWRQNMLDPVLLQRALECAIQDGYTAFIEIGPHPVLGTAIREVLASRGVEGISGFTLKRGQTEGATLYRSVAQLFTDGVPLDWSRIYPTGALVSLPNYPFQRTTHWDEAAVARDARLGRLGATPLLTERESGPNPRFLTNLGRPTLRYLRDHRVQGAVVFPASGYVDAALCACAELQGDDGDLVLEDFEFKQAYVLSEQGTPWLRIDVVERHSTIEFHGRHDEDEWTQHAQTRMLTLARFSACDPIDLSVLRAQISKPYDVQRLYERLSNVGLDYGPAFQRIAELYCEPGTGRVLARLRTDGLQHYPGRVHPVLLDATFQALFALRPSTACTPVVPVNIGRIRQTGLVTETLWAYGEARLETSGEIYGSVRLLDEGGRVIATLDDLVCRPIQTERVQMLNQTKGWVHVDTWQEFLSYEFAEPKGNWVLIGEDERLSGELADVLATHGAITHVCKHVDEIELSISSQVVFLCGRDRNGPTGTEHCTPLLALAQQLADNPKPLRIVTFGAQSVMPGEPASPAQTAVWGLARVIMTEHPELECRLIDLPEGGPIPTPTLVGLLNATSGEEESALRAGTIYVRRLKRVGIENPIRRGLLANGRHIDDAFELHVSKPGRLDSLVWRPRAHRIPQGDELEVEIFTASLNFKDLMKAMGMLSSMALERTYLGTGLGVEAAGKVLRVGEKVKRFIPGDEVLVHQGGCIASHVAVSERYVVRTVSAHDRPAQASYFVFITAWYALVNAARLQNRESVLIHSAAGGVGLACIQVAKLLGAEIFATVGTPEKRDYLKRMGIQHVYDSRTLDFADALLRDTAGRGVDVVINSLAGAAQKKSLEVLAPGGRFVELGKQDIASDTPLGLLPFNRGLSFIAVDLDRMGTEYPEYYAPLAETVLNAFAEGKLKPLPTRVFSAHEATEAFRLMASANHIGKIVLDLSSRDVDVALGMTPKPLFLADRSYLVTGGLGGFGLATAEWMVEKGARYVVLASRRGRPDAQAKRSVACMRERGARVTCLRLDVTQRDSVSEVLRFIRTDLPPLAGIFHSAAVLEDAPILETTRSSLDRGMAAKAYGAWLLHEATLDLDLDHFVLYSSVVSLVGNPGQAVYAAANAYLEGLVTLRRAEGRTATCVSWGAIADVGVVARDAATAKHLLGLGVRQISPRSALWLLGELLQEDHEHIGIIDVDWNKWKERQSNTSWNRLDEVISSEGDLSVDPLTVLKAALAGKTESEARNLVIEKLRGATGSVLRVPVEQLDPAVLLKEYGLDSLMAVELQHAVDEALGVSFSTMELLAKCSLESLAEETLKRVQPKSEEQPKRTASSSASLPLDLRKHLLTRIGVQPPYFDLLDLKRDGAGLTAEVVPLPPQEREMAAVSVAEAGRHLAILGSCAASLECPDSGRIYYPVHTSRLLEHRFLATTQPLPRVRLRACCSGFDLKGARASVETQLMDARGEIIYRFDVDYHIVPEEQFRELFKVHAQATDEASGRNPYAEWRSLPAISSFREGVSVDLGLVEPAQCLGHFVGYPAYPVSIMFRDALELVAEGIRRRNGGEDVRVTSVRGGVTAEQFVFAHQPALLRAYPILRPSTKREKDLESWRCEVLSGESLAASFEMHVLARECGVDDVEAKRAEVSVPG